MCAAAPRPQFLFLRLTNKCLSCLTEGRRPSGHLGLALEDVAQKPNELFRNIRTAHQNALKCCGTTLLGCPPGGCCCFPLPPSLWRASLPRPTPISFSGHVRVHLSSSSFPDLRLLFSVPSSNGLLGLSESTVLDSCLIVGSLGLMFQHFLKEGEFKKKTSQGRASTNANYDHAPLPLFPSHLISLATKFIGDARLFASPFA